MLTNFVDKNKFVINLKDTYFGILFLLSTSLT